MENDLTMKKFRYERKFMISDLDFQLIEHLIKHNPAMFLEKFHERRVNNIYFDSVDFKNYHEKVSGISERIKIRIRWYGKTFSLIKEPVLEIKIKKEELNRKITFKLKSFTLDKNFSSDFLQKKVFEKSSLPGFFAEMLRVSRPVLLNSYERKYFQSVNKKYKITLDKNLSFFKLKNKNNRFNEKILDKDNQILEIKYPEDCDDKILEVTKHFPFRLTASSKYVYGVDLLELW